MTPSVLPSGRCEDCSDEVPYNEKPQSQVLRMTCKVRLNNDTRLTILKWMCNSTGVCHPLCL